MNKCIEEINFIILKVFVPLTRDGVMGWVFKLVCSGYALSISHERLLLLKNATVNRNLGFDAVCNERHVNIAYWEDDQDFHVSKIITNITLQTIGTIETNKWKPGEMAEWKPIPVVGYGEYISWMWEVQKAFFQQNNIQPHWFNFLTKTGGGREGGGLGGFNEFNHTILDQTGQNVTPGHWTGYLGMIERDEVDYAVVPSTTTYGKNNYFTSSAPYQFAPDYFFTRYPLELSPIWNLTRLFTKG